MAIAKMTSKGQITVPREIRKLLGIKPGDKVRFDEEDGEVHVRRDGAESVFEKYRGIGTPGIPPGRKAVIRWTRRMRGR
jgi:AbrB family looped-hinge helix DNA binding protein